MCNPERPSGSSPPPVTLDLQVAPQTSVKLQRLLSCDLQEKPEGISFCIVWGLSYETY